MVSLQCKLQKTNRTSMTLIDLNALYTAPEASDNDSKKTMVYIADDAKEYTVTISENIGQVMGFYDYTTSSTATPMPVGFKMRKITFANADTKVKGSYPVGNLTETVITEGGTITVPRKGKAAGVTCSITGYQGEKKRFAQANDTGQSSGDIT